MRCVCGLRRRRRLHYRRRACHGRRQPHPRRGTAGRSGLHHPADGGGSGHPNDAGCRSNPGDRSGGEGIRRRLRHTGIRRARESRKGRNDETGFIHLLTCNSCHSWGQEPGPDEPVSDQPLQKEADRTGEPTLNVQNADPGPALAGKLAERGSTEEQRQTPGTFQLARL